MDDDAIQEACVQHLNSYQKEKGANEFTPRELQEKILKDCSRQLARSGITEKFSATKRRITLTDSTDPLYKTINEFIAIRKLQKSDYCPPMVLDLMAC